MIEPQVMRASEDGGMVALGLTSELFSRRILSLDTAVTQEGCLLLARAMLELEQEDPDAPITLLIGSPGGDVYAGLGLISVMESVACPVHTVGCGLVASMASVILACGDHRSLYARSHMLIHRLLSGVGMAQQSDIGIVAEQASALRDSLDELLAEHSSMDRATVHAITERDCWLTAPRALELGLIDEVIDPVEKNLAAPAR